VVFRLKLFINELKLVVVNLVKTDDCLLCSIKMEYEKTVKAFVISLVVDDNLKLTENEVSPKVVNDLW
jgi:hypothetical protein